MPHLSTEDLIVRVQRLLEPLLEGTDMFVTAISVKPTANIKLFLDADEGLTVEKSARVNRRLRAALDEEGLFPDGDYSLEVSSPGIDEPITGARQYRKNIGRTLEVTSLEGAAVTGVLKEVTDESLTLEIKADRKKPASEVEIPLTSVKTAIVQVVF